MMTRFSLSSSTIFWRSREVRRWSCSLRISSGLDLAQAELGDEARLGLRGSGGGADEGDHGVEVIEGDDVALQDVRALQGLAQLEGGAAAHDLAPEGDEVLADLQEVQHLRALVDDGQHDDAEAVLELGVLVEVVEQHLAGLALAHVDHDAHAAPVALVADVGDPLDALVAHHLRDLLDEARLVDLVGDLGDHDRLAVALPHLDLRLGPHDHGPAAGAIGLADAGAAVEEPGGGEVGAGHARDHALQPLLRGEVLVPDHEGQGVHHLAQVVGRDVGGHARPRCPPLR